MANEAEHGDPSLITEAYDIIYKQKEYQISFAEVAARRRAENMDFSLEPELRSCFIFFQTPTSSEQLLPSSGPMLQ